jgi:hypothetical protein
MRRLSGASGKSPPRIVTVSSRLIRNGGLWLDPGFGPDGLMRRQFGSNFYTVTTQ